MAFIRKVRTKSGATAVQIVTKAHGEIVGIDHLGSAHTDDELTLLLGLARERLRAGQLSLLDRPASLTLSLGHTVSGVLMDTLTDVYRRLGFDQLADDDFAALCLARIVEPVSKLDSLRVLAELGVTGLSKDRLYRCLVRAVAQDYRATFAQCCVAQATQAGIRLLLYDVTTLYFEIQQEDSYRKPGLSKERRLEPQIVVGLLVDHRGFPLAVHSFEGNTAETTTILPVLEQFRQAHQLPQPVTVVADAGMLSTKNLEALTTAGYRYIVGARLTKIPDVVVAAQATGAGLTDGQILTASAADQRTIYQYREKRAALDRRNIDKQVAKAERIVEGQTSSKRARFVTVTAAKRRLNDALIARAKALAGVKGYVTNLNRPDHEIIAAYHQLWHVEASFRMSKSDLKARPIFHRKRDSIEAHLTVVFAALAVARTIEDRTGLSIQKFVKTIRPIRSGTIRLNGREYQAVAEIPAPVQQLLKKLAAGH